MVAKNIAAMAICDDVYWRQRVVLKLIRKKKYFEKRNISNKEKQWRGNDYMLLFLHTFYNIRNGIQYFWSLKVWKNCLFVLFNLKVSI